MSDPTQPLPYVPSPRKPVTPHSYRLTHRATGQVVGVYVAPSPLKALVAVLAAEAVPVAARAEDYLLEKVMS